MSNHYDLFSDNIAFRRCKRWIENDSKAFQQRVRMQIRNFDRETGLEFWKENYEEHYKAIELTLWNYYIEYTKELYSDFEERFFDKLFPNI
jgi:predicted DsbA family dithiol-disulfide isomerase